MGMKLLQDCISIILNHQFYDEQRRTKSIVIVNEFLPHLWHQIMSFVILYCTFCFCAHGIEKREQQKRLISKILCVCVCFV